MKTISFKPGERESEKFPLANLVLAAIISPSAEKTTLEILGSFDGETFYPIQNSSKEHMIFSLEKSGKIISFNSNDFDGIEWIKLSLSSAPNQQLEVPVYLKNP